MRPAGSATPVPFRTSQVNGWTLREFERVDSTNFVAAQLGAWEAARADTQTAGRGRFQRSWVSDAGGLWLSAVVPLGAGKEKVSTLPLAAGLAVIDALRKLGFPDTRLRWPNDIMVGDRKLAGLLVDSFSARLAVIGIGVNVTNQPAAQDESLRGTVTRLADLGGPTPALAILGGEILASLRTVIGQLSEQGFAALSPRINQLWGGRRRVRLDLDGRERVGLFGGVDLHGRLLLEDGRAVASALEPHQVRLLREI